MRTSIVTISFALVAQELATNHVDNRREQLLDTLVKKEFDNLVRRLESWPLRYSDLHNISLATKKNKQADALSGFKKKVEGIEAQKREAEAAANAEMADTWNDQGNDMFHNGDLAGALEAYSQAIKLDPTNHNLYSNRCAVNLKLRRTRDAVKDAQACTRTAPDFVKGWTRLGQALLEDRQGAAAVEAYRKGLKLDATNQAMLEGVALAEAAVEAEKEEEAKRAAAEAKPDVEVREEVEPVIGIDLGTTYSCVAVWEGDGVKILTDENAMRTTPSYVSWTSTGERLIGHRAKAMAAKHTKSTAYDMKRIIGQKMHDEAVRKELDRFHFPVSEGMNKLPMIELETRPGQVQKFAPEEISAMVLGHMRHIAEQYFGRSVTKAVITVPAYFNDAQRQATKNAGAIAGLEVLRIINEPTAAALAYGLDQGDYSKDKHILVFDLGGGTFDVSVLALSGGNFQVEATGGDTRLGGEDFDNALVDWAVKEFVANHQLQLKEARDLAKLKAACERAKRDLSTSESAMIEIAIEGQEYAIKVTREKFVDMNSKLFARTMERVSDVLKDAKLKPEQIDDIVLVGGSTRVPKIQDMLSEQFGGRQLCRSINPDEAVAYGAAVQAAVLAGVRHQSVNQIVLVDVTPLSLGVEVEGYAMNVVIPRNTKIPYKKAKMYTTEKDYEEALDIRIFEGERPVTKDNHLLGQFRITGIEIAKKHEAQVEVTFSLDSNGMLTVTACDQKTKANAATIINNACKGLSEADIARMIEESEQFAKEDAEHRKKIDLHHEISEVASDLQDMNLQDHDQLVVQETVSWSEQLDLASCPALMLEERKRELLAIRRRMRG